MEEFQSIAKENDQIVFSLLNVLRLQTRSLLLTVFYLEFCFALNSISVCLILSLSASMVICSVDYWALFRRLLATNRQNEAKSVETSEINADIYQH